MICMQFCTLLLPGSCIAVLAVSCPVYAFLHCSIALAFGRQFLSVEACVRYGEGRVVFVVDRVALGQDFVSDLQFHTSLLCILAFGRRSLKLKF
jgi:hypothetical protein